MKYTILILTLLLFSCNETLQPIQQTQNDTRLTKLSEVLDGDIVLQTSTSSQAHAIQLATRSPFTHVGIIIHRNGIAYVYEARGPVGLRSFKAFVSSSADGKTMVRRLKYPINIAALESVSRSFLGKSYDPYFDWSDSKMYCSELVEKVFKRAMNIEVGRLQPLGSLDLSSPEVKEKLRERYGNNIPYNMPVVTPHSIAINENLYTVYWQ